MLFDMFDVDRLKCSITDVMCNLYNADISRFQFIDNLRREMEPCCRSGNCSPLAGIDRLVSKFVQPSVIILLPLNIWRQWSIANFIHNIMEIFIGMELDKTAAFPDNSNNLSPQPSLSKYDLSTGLQRTTWFGQDFPDFGIV